MRRLAGLSNLATEPFLPPGTRVHVAEDDRIYVGIGFVTPDVATRLGWTQGNVWLPLRELERIKHRHPELPDPVASAHAILVNLTPSMKMYVNPTLYIS